MDLISNAIKILKAKKNLRLIDGTNYTSKNFLNLYHLTKYNDTIRGLKFIFK